MRHPLFFQLKISSGERKKTIFMGICRKGMTFFKSVRGEAENQSEKLCGSIALPLQRERDDG